jgi:hypothetical protein
MSEPKKKIEIPKPEVRRIIRLNDRSPNIIAVVNAPTLLVPTRAYIFNIDFTDIYGTLENAVEHFMRRTSIIEEPGIDFRLGFIKGKIRAPTIGDRDIIYVPFEKSNGTTNRKKSRPYMCKGQTSEDFGRGPVSSTTPYINDDMFILLGNERLLFRLNPLEKYASEFPQFPRELGLEYIDD